jgi:hypothetical protein
MIRRVKKLFRSGARRISFPVASFFKIMKVLIQHVRMTYQTELRVRCNRIGSDQFPTAEAHNLRLVLHRRICTTLFSVLLVLAQAYPPIDLNSFRKSLQTTSVFHT